MRDDVDNTGYISHYWHESNSNVLLRCQTWRLSFRFNSLILLVHNKAGSRAEKRSFCYADQKTESGECEQWRLKMTGLPYLRAVFVCLVSHCRTHGKRKRKWLIIGVRNWHILMACGYKIKVILCLSTVGEVWSLPTRQWTAVICFSWILTFQFSAMLKSKDCSTLVEKKATMLDWYFLSASRRFPTQSV